MLALTTQSVRGEVLSGRLFLGIPHQDRALDVIRYRAAYAKASAPRESSVSGPDRLARIGPML